MMVGIVDADLLASGTRHPNLALLKIAGFLHDNGVKFELIFKPDVNLKKYAVVFMSRVFTFTPEPDFYTQASPRIQARFHKGGTGYYATLTGKAFREAREADMAALENDPFLMTLENKRGGTRTHGIDMARQMPFYGLYDAFVAHRLAMGDKPARMATYKDFSMGFLTRRCVRHCPFCVNRLENGVVPYSKLEWFHDTTRPHVYLWDDNFLAAPREIWQPLLQMLIDRRVSFSFRQGLDERMLAESPHGEEMAEMLSRCRLHGDVIFAFDNWRDRETIERALLVWRKYNPRRSTKFYLFTGFRQCADKPEAFYRDVWELFARIRVLMKYGCLGYVMRHEDYHSAPLPNIYTQVARWVNQPAFYKKQSFFQYCYRNQSLWEQKHLPELHRPDLKTFDEFMADVAAEFYETTAQMCQPLRTVLDMLAMFPERRDELLDMFNTRMPPPAIKTAR